MQPKFVSHNYLNARKINNLAVSRQILELENIWDHFWIADFYSKSIGNNYFAIR